MIDSALKISRIKTVYVYNEVFQLQGTEECIRNMQVMQNFHRILKLFMQCLCLFGGVVTQRVERWTCDQQVVGSNPTRGKRCVTTLGKLFTLMCLGHQAV